MGMSRLLCIAPVKVDEGPIDFGVENTARPGNTVDVVGFDRGTRHLEYHYYEALTVPDIVHTVLEAERQGYDAAVIGCFYDLALHESREMATRIVVTAPCESALLLAASLGSTFSIIVGRRKWIPQMKANVHHYGFGERLASFRTLEFGVLDYHTDEAETERRFIEAGRKAIEDDGAEVIVLGCTASSGFFQRMQDALGVPVIDSAIAAFKHAEQLIEIRDRFGWSTSKIGGYETPPASEMEAWNLREDYGADTITDRWRFSVATTTSRP
jgi:allantoin racemase